MDWSKFQLSDGKHTLAQPCLDVVAFSYADPATCGPGFERLLRSFVERHGPALRFYRTGDMKRFRPFEAKALDAPSHWFSNGKMLATKMLGFVAHSGESEKYMVAPAADLALMGFDEPPCFVFRLMLPTGAAEAPDEVIRFVQEGLSDFPLDSGYVGYSFLWNEMDPAQEKAVGKWAAPLMLRHPGLAYGSAVAVSNAADRGVAAIGWLTLLGSKLTAELGGRAGLKKRAPAGVSVLPLGSGGTILQAGSEPQIGDVNRKDGLPAYRAVARLVAPRRTPDEAFEDVAIEGMSDSKADDWLRRFFV